MSKIGQRLGAALLIVICISAAPMLWIQWDVHRVESFCGDIHPGMPVSALPALAERHSVDPLWLNHTVKDDAGNDWLTFVPAPSTFGDITCNIHHDTIKVIAADVIGD
jgi:hypothetical protein